MYYSTLWNLNCEQSVKNWGETSGCLGFETTAGKKICMHFSIGGNLPKEVGILFWRAFKNPTVWMLVKKSTGCQSALYSNFSKVILDWPDFLIENSVFRFDKWVGLIRSGLYLCVSQRDHAFGGGPLGGFPPGWPWAPPGPPGTPGGGMGGGIPTGGGGTEGTFTEPPGPWPTPPTTKSVFWARGVILCHSSFLQFFDLLIEAKSCW